MLPIELNFFCNDVMATSFVKSFLSKRADSTDWNECVIENTLGKFSCPSRSLTNFKQPSRTNQILFLFCQPSAHYSTNVVERPGQLVNVHSSQVQSKVLRNYMCNSVTTLINYV